MHKEGRVQKGAKNKYATIFRRIIFSLLFVCGVLAFALGQNAKSVNAQKDTAAPVYVLPMKGAVGPALSSYLESGIRKAETAGAQLLVIKLDTPGGLLTTTREMVQDIVESPVPIAVWVAPTGAHAASAGTFLLYASHIAAMDEGTNVGAATPIEMGGPLDRKLPSQEDNKTTPEDEEQDASSENKDTKTERKPASNEQAMANKALEDTAAFIRGIAEMRGRNVEWAEEAVVKASSITAREALEKNVIDYIAKDITDLLNQTHGRTVTLKDGLQVTLNTQAAPVVIEEMDFRTKIISIITDPNIAFILMTIGIYGLILEFYNPGTMIPGTIGVISLILALYALNILPVNAAGIALLLAGVGFMVAETFVPSFGILGIGGLIAFIFGAIFMYDETNMPGLELEFTVIAGMAFFAAAVILFIILITLNVYRKKITTGTESMIGEEAKVVSWEGAEGKVFIQGEHWQAYSEEELILSEDDIVIISKVDNLQLKIIPNT